jgi:hypothetical protein
LRRIVNFLQSAHTVEQSVTKIVFVKMNLKIKSSALNSLLIVSGPRVKLRLGANWFVLREFI